MTAFFLTAVARPARAVRDANHFCSYPDECMSEPTLIVTLTTPAVCVRVMIAFRDPDGGPPPMTACPPTYREADRLPAPLAALGAPRARGEGCLCSLGRRPVARRDTQATERRGGWKERVKVFVQQAGYEPARMPVPLPGHSPSRELPVCRARAT